MCCISLGWQLTVDGYNCHGNLYADQYDFYPLLPSVNGRALIKSSPGTLGNELPKSFQGQIYPDVPFAPPLGAPKPDPQLLLVLNECWQRYYVCKEQSWLLTALFRSLAYAFKAARMPKGCDNALFDYGVQSGLWYSAFECLLHPGEGRVGINDVIQLLGRRVWGEEALDNKENFRLRNEDIKGNFVQRVCGELYCIRNAFLHGNRVTVENLTRPKTIKKGVLFQILPLIYQVALEEFAYLNEFVQGPDTQSVVQLMQECKLSEAVMMTYQSRLLPQALLTFQSGANSAQRQGLIGPD